MAQRKGLESSLKNLTLNPLPSKSAASSKKKKDHHPISESWEDEELEDSGDETDRPLSPQHSAAYPSAPPPTPISPSSSFAHEMSVGHYGLASASFTEIPTERIRPEKTDAVAKRMIAGALGVRAPPKTQEQKAYDRAIKEKEIRRRNQEKEAAAVAREETERAKAAAWED